MKYKSYSVALVVIVIATFVATGTAEAKVLSRGSSGNEVAELQKFLINGGFPIPLIESGQANLGYFGPQTENAVKMYQEDSGESLTGIIDSRVFSEGRLGAVATLDGVDNPYTTINGVGTYYYSQPITATSSAFCSIRNPYATTTIPRSLNVQVSANGMGATIIDISTSTSQYGTSSPAFVKAFSLGANAAGNIIWAGGSGTSTSATVLGLTNTATGVTNGTSDIFLKANEYITFRISSSTPGTFTTYLSGRCTGVLQSL